MGFKTWRNWSALVLTGVALSGCNNGAQKTTTPTPVAQNQMPPGGFSTVQPQASPFPTATPKSPYTPASGTGGPSQFGASPAPGGPPPFNQAGQVNSSPYASPSASNTSPYASPSSPSTSPYASPSGQPTSPYAAPNTPPGIPAIPGNFNALPPAQPSMPPAQPNMGNYNNPSPNPGFAPSPSSQVQPSAGSSFAVQSGNNSPGVVPMIPPPH